jgi:hypothetical protein
MKSMTLNYIPPKEYKDDPPITLATFSPSPSITLMDHNLSRIELDDVKGFEVIILLFASLFTDIIKSTQVDSSGSLAQVEVKRETERLAKLEKLAEERWRKQEQEEIEKETDRLRKLAVEEGLEQDKLEKTIQEETEMLRRQEGLPLMRASSSQSGKKKHWWRNAAQQWKEASPYVEQPPSYRTNSLVGF